MNEKNEEQKPGRAPRTVQGGYSARFSYEKQKNRSRSIVKTASVVVLFLILAVFSVLGVVALAKGAFIPENEGSGTSIMVPTQNQLALAARGPSDMIRDLAPCQLVVEAVYADGSISQGSGFILSDDGYAVCSSHLIDKEKELTDLYAYLSDGRYVQLLRHGANETLGILLVQLTDSHAADLKNRLNAGFVSRGDTLYLVGSSYKQEYRGTVLSGLATSVNSSVKLERETISVIYVDATPNPTLCGAPAVNENGQIVGFITDAVECPWDNMCVVIPMANVFVVVNELMS